jgi:transcriptional regulator with XRE-family HTH domain
MSEAEAVLDEGQDAAQRAAASPGVDEDRRSQLRQLGEFLREQRRSAQLSLRQVAARANISNPYLSQIERGLHEPSSMVLRSLARALGVSAETLLAQAGVLDRAASHRHGERTSTEDAILADPRLSPAARQALLAVYRCLAEPASPERDGGSG